VPSQTRFEVNGLRISAAHLPHFLRRTPLYLVGLVHGAPGRDVAEVASAGAGAWVGTVVLGLGFGLGRVLAGVWCTGARMIS